MVTIEELVSKQKTENMVYRNQLDHLALIGVFLLYWQVVELYDEFLEKYVNTFEY